MTEWLSYTCALVSVGTLAWLVSPALTHAWLRAAGKVEQVQQVRVEKATKALDEIFMEVKPAGLKVIYGLGPLLAGAAGYVLFHHWVFGLLGAGLGILLPDLWVRQVRAYRNRQFRAQLVDVLFTLSSSLRAGLSLTQAFEVVESEMGPPASQEFGLVLKANRVGMAFEESLQRLNARMPSDEMQLVTTAILVARETGGDVTGIISQLVNTIREKKKLRDKVQTLTLQGRLQAYIMSILPVAFAATVRSFNPTYFDLMLRDSTGVLLLGLAGLLWVAGMVLLMKLSKVEI